ncbi:MAG: hypothetical protein RLN90_00485 [Balneolaceae bacterium]
MKVQGSILLIVLTSYFGFGCSTSEYLTAFSSVQTDSLKQINDEDIRKAFEANPQITIPASIAIYNASQDKFPFQDSILTIQEVQRAVEISPALLDPNAYYKSQQDPYWNRYNPTPKPIDLKQLRLYAAQTKADLVLFVSSSTVYKEEMNVLSPLYAGLVTIPFVPGQHAQLTTYLEAYIFDVRNGLLYSSYRDKRILKKRFVRVNFERKTDVLKNEQINEMIPDFLSYVESTLNHPSLRLSVLATHSATE